MVEKEVVDNLVRTIKDSAVPTARELQQIAPDTVPGSLKYFMDLSEDEIRNKLTAELQSIEDNEELSDEEKENAQTRYLAVLNSGLEEVTKSLKDFTEVLQRRIQPEGIPRQKREINQFKKRKGEWA